MSDTKYGKYIITDVYKKFYQTESLTVTPDQLGTGCIITSQGFNAPISNVGGEVPHKHGFHQVLCFLGGDPNNIRDFGAEVEVCLGEEMEKHVITSPVAINVPPGVPHCPINVIKIDKPIVFIEVMLTEKYEKTEKDGSHSPG